MKAIIKWINEALAVKEIGPAMTHYRMQNNTICATNGNITASHPWPYEGEFLVSGAEFEKILGRMEDEPTLAYADGKVTIKQGRFRGTIHTLPLTDWNYPDVSNAVWQSIPPTLLPVLKSLRAFIADNPAQAWAGCVALEHDNCYATNNIALAGMACPGLGAVEAMLPSWAVDFVLKRTEGLESWAWTDNYVAFRWSNGAWMRSQLVIGKFPERAAALVRESYDETPSQEITDKFRAAFKDVADLAEDTIQIYADRLESRYKKSVLEADVVCEVPEASECSVWGAKFLIPVISQATHWNPKAWPDKASFKGPNVSGFVVGRKR